MLDVRGLETQDSAGAKPQGNVAEPHTLIQRLIVSSCLFVTECIIHFFSYSQRKLSNPSFYLITVSTATFPPRLRALLWPTSSNLRRPSSLITVVVVALQITSNFTHHPTRAIVNLRLGTALVGWAASSPAAAQSGAGRGNMD
jgi:lysylphosphatidylglycerol synthetase-like protein (DUF2156 family)